MPSAPDTVRSDAQRTLYCLVHYIEKLAYRGYS